MKAYKRSRVRTLVFLTIILVIGVVFIFKNQQSASTENPSSLSLRISEHNIHLYQGERHDIFAIMEYSNGLRENVTDSSKFSFSNKKIISIDEYGSITALAPGKTKVTIIYHNDIENIEVTVSSEMRQVNVKDYGAIGDGIADDTKAFQKAIDDLANKGGGDVFIPEGIYILNPIFLKPRVNLNGQDRDTVILKYADNAPDGQHRLVTMEDYTKVKNLTCDGNYQEHPKGTEHMHCLFAFDHDHIVIENNRLINAVGDGISISGTTKASNYVVIKNNIVEENQRSQIVIEQVNHLLIKDNQISSITGRPGIHFEPWEDRQYYDARIMDNTIRTNSKGYCGLLAGGDSERAGNGETGYFYHGIAFHDNRVVCPNGVFLIEDTDGIQVYNNTLTVGEIKLWRKNKNVHIYHNRIQAEVGVYIEGDKKGSLISEGTKIDSNIFYTNSDGVYMIDGAKTTEINDNLFVGTEKNGFGVKLFVTDEIQDITIKGNHYSNYEKGVYIDYLDNFGNYMKDLKVQSNSFNDLESYAFYLQGPVQNAIMEDNIVANASGAYIDVHNQYKMMKITITNNILSNGNNGIIQNNEGKGVIEGLDIIGNQISNMAGNDGYAAIELVHQSISPINITIKDNILNDNRINIIAVPDSLEKYVDNNRY